MSSKYSDSDEDVPDSKKYDITYKPIIPGFCYGTYSDLKIIMMEKNRYFNASHLCKSKGKQYSDWSKLKSSKGQIKSISKLKGIKISDLIIEKKGGGGDHHKVKGTYVHPSIMTHVAIWVSFDFGTKVSDIVNDYLDKERNILIKKQKKLLEKKDDIIKKKNDKIDDLSDKIDILMKEQKELLNFSKETKEHNHKLSNKQDKILKNSKYIKKKLKKTQNHAVVPTKNKKDQDMFIIVENRNNSDNKHPKKSKYEYTVFRVSNAVKETALKKHMIKNPRMKNILEIPAAPNSRNLWKRVQDGLKKKLNIHRCDFDLKGSYSEEQLISDINKIHDARFESSDSESSDSESSDSDSSDSSDSDSD